MRIELRYFAIVRELLEKSRETLDVAPGTTAGDVLRTLEASEPRLASASRSIMLMVNQRYVKADHPLADGDEMALIPPVSGGETTATPRFLVSDDPLDARAVEAVVAAPGAGAVVTFTGVVRDTARGERVMLLDYEAYGPAAVETFRQIAAEIEAAWPGSDVALHHRTGALTVGETSVVIAVSSAHRDAAFAACRHAIERIKEITPIWKKEHYADGAVWIGSEAEYQRQLRANRVS